MDLAFGVQLHHPRFFECIKAPKSARLLGCSLAEWVQTMDRQDAMAAALQLQRDADLMTSNWFLGQYVTSLNQMSSEVMCLAFGPKLFPSEVVNVVAPVPWVHRAATQMTAVGLWRPLVGPGVLGPMPASHYNNGTSYFEIQLMTGKCHCDIDMDIPRLFVIINGRL